MKEHKKMEWGFWRVAWLIISLICAVWGALPLTASRVHVGCITMIGGGLLSGVCCLFLPSVIALWQRLWATVAGKLCLTGLSMVVALLLLLFIGVSVVMTVAACRKPPENATVIVLGARVRGDRPSRTLRERLDAAAEYLNAHLDAACVLSGGQGEDELCTEAYAMKQYLLDKGIAEERLYLEEQSTSTYENLQFSRQVIQENGLSETVAVVTQEFHQCRAQAFAKKVGFEQVGPITAHTKWDLFPSYWIRDFAGLCHMVVFGF